MTKVVYQIIEHDGGFAYKVGDTFSETFVTEDAARHAALVAAREHVRPDEDTEIEFEDRNGRWHAEHADGADRPDVDVT